jgi:hypothetical protein
MVVDESAKPELFRNVESSSEIRGEYVPFSDCLGCRTTQFPQSTFATHASVSLRRICLDATLAVIAGFARVGKNTYTHVSAVALTPATSKQHGAQNSDS